MNDSHLRVSVFLCSVGMSNMNKSTRPLQKKISSYTSLVYGNGSVPVLSCCFHAESCVPVKSKFQHPLQATPEHLNFWEIFVQILPPRAEKLLEMPPPPGKLPDYCFITFQ